MDEQIQENDGTAAVQEHPQELQDQNSAPTYGERNEELPDQLVNALKEAVREFAGQEKDERRREVVRDRRARFYEAGVQHIYEDSKTGYFTPGVAGSTLRVGDKTIETPTYIDDYNIFAPCLEILIAILTQNQPGVDFQPDNPNYTEDLEAAATAESYREYFDRSNQIKTIQTQMVRMMGLSGRTVTWTRTEANAQTFGCNEDGSAKRNEIVSVHGTLESRVPITAKRQEDFLYTFLLDDIDIKNAKAQYPQFEDKIKSGSSSLGESAYERVARLGVTQSKGIRAGEVHPHLVTHLQVWLRPAAFTGEKYQDLFEEAGEGDVNQDGGTMTVKEKLRQLFPSGCHCVFVGDTYVGSWDESMDDHIAVAFPSPGDGQSCQAMMTRGIVIQDRFNDDQNAYAEVKDFGWPSTWVNADNVEYDSILEQRAVPFAVRQKKVRNGIQTSQEFFREPDPQIPQTFVAHTESLLNLLYFMLATPPALFGQAEADQKTASGFAQMRAQAMGRLGLAWGALQELFAKIYKQASTAAGKNPDHSKEIVVPGKGGQNTTLRLERLTKGKFGAYPDIDSGFPESTEAKRQQLGQLENMAALSPSLAAQLFESPDNWEVFSRLMGFPELTFMEGVSRDKQMSEIEQLLMSPPVPPNPMALDQAMQEHAAQSMQANSMGQPEPPAFDPTSLMEPTIPVDELDYHQYEGKKGQEWLSSVECRRQLAEGNYGGVLNVKLHTKQHLQFAAQAAMAAMPPPMAAPHKGAPPPPNKPQGDLSAPNSLSAPPGAPGALTM